MAIADIQRMQNVRNVFEKYQYSFNNTKYFFNDLQNARERASWIKEKVIRSLDNYLIEFESNFTKKGGKIFWAQTIVEAQEIIDNKLQEWKCNLVVKSKSMLSEEIKLNEFLKSKGIESIETDLGEFIQQCRNESPFHMVTPAMHLTAVEITNLYRNKFSYKDESNAESLANFTRLLLREKFKKADVGISGANFLLADVGGIAITENEGNVALCASQKRHIVIAGIERIIPSVLDLDLFWPLLSLHGTGQKITRMNHIITPEVNGDTEMILILLNNKRTEALKEPIQRSVLKCIRCGACHSVCPVYKSIGGFAYSNSTNGPIAKALLPAKHESGESNYLANASTLCGNCTVVCPVNIELHKIILHNRAKSNAEMKPTVKERLSIYFWKEMMLDRKKMEFGAHQFRKTLFKLLFSKAWGEERLLPELANKSFRQIMQIDKTQSNK